MIKVADIKDSISTPELSLSVFVGARNLVPCIYESSISFQYQKRFLPPPNSPWWNESEDRVKTSGPIRDNEDKTIESRLFPLMAQRQ